MLKCGIKNNEHQKRKKKSRSSCLIEFSLLKKSFSRYLLSRKKINWKNRNKKKERLKWPWPHPLPKKTSRPLSSPCPCYVLCARKSCNHVQISIICLKCEFFLAKNWIVLNRMTKNIKCLSLSFSKKTKKRTELSCST